MGIGARLVVALAVLAVLAGCTGPGLDKAGGRQARQPVVLTLANFDGTSGELDGFANNVARLSGATMRIDIEYHWRFGQVRYENGLIADVRAGKANLGVVGSRAWDSVGVNSFRALTAPLLIGSYALQDRVLRSPMIGQMLQVWVPRTSSSLRDQAIFVDQTTDASLPSDAVLLKIDRFG